MSPNLGMISKIALNMLRQNKDYKCSNPMKKMEANKNIEYREKLLGLTKS